MARLLKQHQPTRQLHQLIKPSHQMKKPPNLKRRLLGIIQGLMSRQGRFSTSPKKNSFLEGIIGVSKIKLLSYIQNAFYRRSSSNRSRSWIKDKHQVCSHSRASNPSRTRGRDRTQAQRWYKVWFLTTDVI